MTQPWKQVASEFLTLAVGFADDHYHLGSEEWEETLRGLVQKLGTHLAAEEAFREQILALEEDEDFADPAIALRRNCPVCMSGFQAALAAVLPPEPLPVDPGEIAEMWSEKPQGMIDQVRAIFRSRPKSPQDAAVPAAGQAGVPLRRELEPVESGDGWVLRLSVDLDPDRQRLGEPFPDHLRVHVRVPPDPKKHEEIKGCRIQLRFAHPDQRGVRWNKGPDLSRSPERSEQVQVTFGRLISKEEIYSQSIANTNLDPSREEDRRVLEALLSNVELVLIEGSEEEMEMSREAHHGGEAAGSRSDSPGGYVVSYGSRGRSRSVIPWIISQLRHFYSCGRRPTPNLSGLPLLTEDTRPEGEKQW
jgi:hypothetical protein